MELWILAIAALAFVLIEAVGLPRRIEEAKVTAKIADRDLRIIPMPPDVPLADTVGPVLTEDRYTILAEIRGRTVSGTVSQERFKRIKEGDEVLVEFGIGRISRRIYLKRFAPSCASIVDLRGIGE